MRNGLCAGISRIGIGIAAMGMSVPALTQSHDDPLTRPIAPQSAQRWLGPQAPVRIHGQTYLVGFAGLNVALIRTSAGLILMDGAVPQAVSDVKAHIRALGFSIRDVKLILSTGHPAACRARWRGDPTRRHGGHRPCYARPYRRQHELELAIMRREREAPRLQDYRLCGQPQSGRCGQLPLFRTR